MIEAMLVTFMGGIVTLVKRGSTVSSLKETILFSTASCQGSTSTVTEVCWPENTTEGGSKVKEGGPWYVTVTASCGGSEMVRSKLLSPPARICTWSVLVLIAPMTIMLKD